MATTVVVWNGAVSGPNRGLLNAEAETLRPAPKMNRRKSPKAKMLSNGTIQDASVRALGRLGRSVHLPDGILGRLPASVMWKV